MNVSVTEKEFDDTAILLEAIKVWREVEKIDQQYVQWMINIQADGGAAKSTKLTVTTPANGTNPKWTVPEATMHEVRKLVAARVAAMAEEVVSLLANALPIPVEVR